MAAARQDELRCLLCEQVLPKALSDRGLTDCAHEFCLACICKELVERKNHCPACHAHVKRVHQLSDDNTSSTSTTAAPALVKYCNATYVLNVSIWAVDDPARVLASLFNLEHARLIHKGKLLKKGDIWPGTVVQLFGTRKGTMRVGTVSSDYSTLITKTWLQRAQQIICCPFSVIYDFFRSLFGFPGNDQRGQRGYIRAATREELSTTRETSFDEPGRVPSPHYTDSI